MLIPTEDPELVLREWRTSDRESIVRHGDNRNVWLGLTDMFPHPYTLQHADDWIELANKPSSDLLLAIDLRGEAIGGVGIVAGEGNRYHTGLLGYWLGEPHWGRGIATKVVRAVLNHAFAGERFVRLEARVYATNPASMRVLEKAGFTREGLFRKSILKDGRILDSVLYAAIREDESEQ